MKLLKPISCRREIGRGNVKPPDTLVESLVEGFSDGSSILPASTILRSQRSEERRMPSVAGREFEAAKEGCFGPALRDFRLRCSGGQDGWQALSFHYVYILRSVSHAEQTYGGLTHDLKARLAKHNDGGSPHTAKFRPWMVKTAVAFTSRERAAAFETYLKSGSGHEFRRRHF